MKKILFMGLLILPMLSCKKEAKTSLTTEEAEMIGTWTHDITVLYDANGDTSMVTQPVCSTASITFSDTQYESTASITDDYLVTDDRYCTGLENSWRRPDATTLVMSGTNFTIIQITSSYLELVAINNPNQHFYYSK